MKGKKEEVRRRSMGEWRIKKGLMINVHAINDGEMKDEMERKGIWKGEEKNE